MIRRRREARAPTIGDASQSLIAGALLPLAAVLRFLWLGHASLSIDELFSVCWSQLDLHFLLGEGARTETNSPGYYVPLHVRMAFSAQLSWPSAPFRP
jgi:hypothetical protein